MTRTILVTGGCGFIGSHFVRYLLRERPGVRVVNVDKLTYAGNPANLTEVRGSDRYRFVQGDVADSALVDGLFVEERPWAVVNFAAESHVDRSIADPSPFLRSNVLGTHVLLDGSRRTGVERLVQISTDEVYGDAEGMAPFTEDAPLHPSSPYAASKAAGDLLCLAYRRTYGVPTLIVRSVNNYGARQFPEKLIPLVIRNALAGETMPVYGDGRQVRDWLYVEDNCDAILRVLERGRPGDIYNAAAGEHRRNIDVVQDLCRTLAEEAGLGVDVLLGRIRHVPDRPGHDRRYALDGEKLRRELSWTPRTRFDVGLRATVRWYLQNRAWLEHAASLASQGRR